jgi:hypothetical protein
MTVRKGVTVTEAGVEYPLLDPVVRVTLHGSGSVDDSRAIVDYRESGRQVAHLIRPARE